MSGGELSIEVQEVQLTFKPCADTPLLMMHRLALQGPLYTAKLGNVGIGYVELGSARIRWKEYPLLIRREIFPCLFRVCVFCTVLNQ